MERVRERFVNRYEEPRATSAASEWGRTFLTQSVIGILLAVLWAMLGLQ